MQDTKNLKKKVIEYEKMIKDYKDKKDQYNVDYWTSELNRVKERIEFRAKNKKKNDKQYKKAN